MLRERRRHANFKPNRKLDRKSSRGMIYENEELRLRTININAEVERGQSDIKKLRRENYQLRKEIWTLRDEYDRLGKLLKNKNHSGYGDTVADIDPEQNEHYVDNDDEYDYEYDEDDRCCSCHSNEGSISCDICNEDEQCHNDGAGGVRAANAEKDLAMIKSNMQNKTSNTSTSSASVNTGSILKSSRSEKLDISFDHLSVVSEECLSNSDDQLEQQKRNKKHTTGLEHFTSYAAEKSALDDYQSTVPPLAHFENLSYKDIGPNIDTLAELQYNSESTPTTGETVMPSLEWDFTSNQPTTTLTTASPQPAIAQFTQENEETTAKMTASSTEATSAKAKPKYFFAPLKSARKLLTQPNEAPVELRPDLYISNVLPSDSNRLATIRRPHNPLKCPSGSQFTNPIYANVAEPKTNGDLDEILHDIHDLSQGIENMQLQNNQNVENNSPTAAYDSDHQPYRTEMSLILSYDGNKSKFSTNSTLDASDIDTPPPNIPNAMKLLPNTLQYVMKYDKPSTEARLNDHGIGPFITEPSSSSTIDRKNTDENIDNNANEEIMSKSSNLLSTDLDDNHAVPAKSNNQNSRSISCARKNLLRRKSSLSGAHIKHAVDTDREKYSTTANDTNEGAGVSRNNIVESKALAEPSVEKIDISKNEASTETKLPQHNTPDLKNSKSSRRVSIHFNGKSIGATGKQSNLDQPQSVDLDPDRTTAGLEESLTLTPILCSRRHHSASNRKLSQDSIGSFAYAAIVPTLTPNKRSKKTFLSRRHSDSLLPSTAQRHQYYPDCGTSSTSKHHQQHGSHSHHNHHNHLHVQPQPSHNYNKERDSFQEAGTSISERCSNSLASSRESSTSLSQRSTSQQKRKLSITSHSQSGGKIPWCACWGNGCL